jgi:Iap family predicted aminopeptidase
MRRTIALSHVLLFIGLEIGGRCTAVGAGTDGVRSAGGRRERAAAVIGSVLTGTETRENMRALCDEIGGRVTGTAAGRQAREFAERLFNKYGLANVHQEAFDLLAWERGPFVCEITAPRHFAMHAVALANTPSTPPVGIEAEVVDAGHGYPEEIDLLGEEVKGKFVLATSGSLPGKRWMHRSEVMALVAERGAAGLLYQTTKVGNLPMTGMCWEGGLSPLPGAGVSFEDGELIRRNLMHGERVRVRIRMTNLIGPATSANVVGEIPGRKNEYVLVGAHLDSWDLGQGAVDNGTGVIAVLEAARALSAVGAEPEATIRFVLFMGEELGLVGARAYARDHVNDLPDCRAMINCDMEGMPIGIRLMGHEYANPYFEGMLKDLSGFELTGGISNRPGIYGDHQPFFMRGVPVVSLRSRLENRCWEYYHTSADTYDKLTFRQLDLAGAFIAVLALELASAESRVMEHLGETEVEELISRYDLEEALRYWGDWHEQK